MKSPAKKWRIQTFYFDFHEVLVLLNSQPCVFRYSFFMVFDLCNCRQPLSEAKIIRDHLTDDTDVQWCFSWNLLPDAVLITLKLRLCWVNRTVSVLTRQKEKRREKKQAWEKPRYAKCLQLPASTLPFTIYEQVVTGDCNDCSCSSTAQMN